MQTLMLILLAIGAGVFIATFLIFYMEDPNEFADNPVSQGVRIINNLSILLIVGSGSLSVYILVFPENTFMNILMFWGSIALAINILGDKVVKKLGSESIYAISRSLPLDQKKSNGTGIFTPFTGGRVVFLSILEAFQDIYNYKIGRNLIATVPQISAELKDVQTFLNIRVFACWDPKRPQQVFELGLTDKEREDEIILAIESASTEISEKILINETYETYRRKREEIHEKIKFLIDKIIDSKFPVDITQIMINHSPPADIVKVLNEAAASKIEMETLKSVLEDADCYKAGNKPTLEQMDLAKKILVTNEIKGERKMIEISGLDKIDPELAKAFVAYMENKKGDK